MQANTTQTLDKEIADLETQLSGDMFKDMEIRDKIHNLKMKQTGAKPMDSQIDCVGCGS